MSDAKTRVEYMLSCVLVQMRKLLDDGLEVHPYILFFVWAAHIYYRDLVLIAQSLNNVLLYKA